MALAACRIDDPRQPRLESRLPAGLEPRFAPPPGWAWGLVSTPGAPAARYGVAAPSGRPRGDILILTSYGEPAEVWFETASDLIAKDYVVWVLEPIGQGGSGRYGLVRDLGDAPSLDPDVSAMKRMAGKIIRRRPLTVIASGTSAPAALLASRSGAGADGLVLTAPRLAPEPAGVLSFADRMRQLNLDVLPSDLGWRWSRKGPDDRALGLTHDARRGRVRLLWQTRNPQLRMGGPSWRWRAALSRAVDRATGPAAARLQAPVLILQPDRGAPPATRLCRRLPRCALDSFGPAGAELELEADEPRAAWLSAVDAFAQQHGGGFSAPPTRARLRSGG